MLITEAEFKEWLTYPVTIQFMRCIDIEMDGISKRTIGDISCFENPVKGAYYAGRYDGMKDKRNVQYEDLLEEE